MTTEHSHVQEASTFFDCLIELLKKELVEIDSSVSTISSSKTKMFLWDLIYIYSEEGLENCNGITWHRPWYLAINQ